MILIITLKKIALAQVAQFNFILVVGQKEVQNKTVNLRVRDESKPVGEKKIEELITMFAGLVKEFK